MCLATHTDKHRPKIPGKCRETQAVPSSLPMGHVENSRRSGRRRVLRWSEPHSWLLPELLRGGRGLASPSLHPTSTHWGAALCGRFYCLVFFKGEGAVTPEESNVRPQVSRPDGGKTGDLVQAAPCFLGDPRVTAPLGVALVDVREAHHTDHWQWAEAPKPHP